MNTNLETLNEPSTGYSTFKVASHVSHLEAFDNTAVKIFPERRSGVRSPIDEMELGQFEDNIDVKKLSVLGSLTKRVLDFTGALIGLILLSPVFLVTAIIVKVTSKGPIFFGQTRLTQGGRQFKMWKFRTMVVNAEQLKDSLMAKNEMSGPVFKIKNDPRITKIGGILRKTSLDEIPQLLNVLIGDMSLVGPRPPVPKEVVKYRRWQSRRLSVKTGITCIWQVSGRNNIDFENWMRLDLQYVDKWSLWLDVTLLAKTIRVVTKGDGAS